MKHSIHITAILISLFVCAQIIGLGIINAYHPSIEIIDEETNTVIIIEESREMPLGIERPEIEENWSWLYLLIAILIGTGILIALIRANAVKVTKAWFFLACFIGLAIAFNAFIPQLPSLILAAALAGGRMIKNNQFIHNLAELFIYGGIAALLYTMISLFAAIMLIIAIAIYDIIAVWKIKHMITLATHQTKNNMFAGLYIPYAKDKQKKSKSKITTHKTKKSTNQSYAVLGGGDIAFSLIFAAAVMKTYSLVYAFIPIATATVALTLLFILAQKNKFYPAMPFIGAGCLIGLGIVVLIV